MTESEFTASDETPFGMCDGPTDPLHDPNDDMELAKRMVGFCRKCREQPKLYYEPGCTSLKCKCGVAMKEPDHDPLTLAKRFNSTYV